jgi:hypothetical protein
MKLLTKREAQLLVNEAESIALLPHEGSEVARLLTKQDRKARLMILVIR